MNDEIKEILDSIKTSSEMSKDTNCFIYRNDYIQKLLDYITNLQQENERLKTKTKEQSLLLIDYQDMEQKSEDYKSRCEKAVEYIKKCYRIYDIDDNAIQDILLNILNGKGSDE